MILPSSILSFLKDLKNNNSREWFDINRSRYQEARTAFELYVSLVMAEIQQFDKEAVKTTPKDCIFRIFRDIRFSHDKTPYKNNFGAYIAKGGRKSPLAGYYLHIEPGASMLAGGIYMPRPDVLKAIRTSIYHNVEEFKEILSHPSFRKHFGEIEAPRLSTAPKGFPKDFMDIALLQFKYYTVARGVPDSAVVKPGFTDEIKEVFKAMVPFNRFLNDAVSNP
ncbi:MAG: DUF2461 domain-containing protein [Bacteroidales bacterium]|nr:DUF2461 domain-containing protein [Bacteroidales bacterium]